MKRKMFLALCVLTLLIVTSLSVGGVYVIAYAENISENTEIVETTEETTEEEMSSLDVWWKENGAWISTLFASLGGVGTGIVTLFLILYKAGKRIKIAITGLNDGSMTLDGVKNELKSIKDDYVPQLQKKYNDVCAEVNKAICVIKAQEGQISELKTILIEMVMGSSELVKKGIADKLRNMEIKK